MQNPDPVSLVTTLRQSYSPGRLKRRLKANMLDWFVAFCLRHKPVSRLAENSLPYNAFKKHLKWAVVQADKSNVPHTSHLGNWRLSCHLSAYRVWKMLESQLENITPQRVMLALKAANDNQRPARHTRPEPQLVTIKPVKVRKPLSDAERSKRDAVLQKRLEMRQHEARIHGRRVAKAQSACKVESPAPSPEKTDSLTMRLYEAIQQPWFFSDVKSHKQRKRRFLAEPGMQAAYNTFRADVRKKTRKPSKEEVLAEVQVSKPKRWAA